MNEKKGKVFVFGHEGVGHGDDTMGFEILMTLLDALVKREEKPAGIIFGTWPSSSSSQARRQWAA